MISANTTPKPVATTPGLGTAPANAEPSELERAFADLEAEIRAVPTDRLVHITVDVRYVAINTVARVPRIRSLRADILGHLSRFDISALDRLDTYALAAAQAHLIHQTSAATPAQIAELAARATERRAILLADVNALVGHGLIDGAPLAGLAGVVGYRNIAYDLLTLRQLLVDAWPRIEFKTALTADELEQDAATASRLLRATSSRSLGPSEPNETAVLRDQAFTLFVEKYGQVRRAVSYVRWDQGDADEFAPSLYSGRNRKIEETPDDALPATVASPATAAAAASATASSADASHVAPNPAGPAAASPFVA